MTASLLLKAVRVCVPHAGCAKYWAMQVCFVHVNHLHFKINVDIAALSLFEDHASSKSHCHVRQYAA